MALEPIGSSSLSSLFRPAASGPGPLARLFGSQEAGPPSRLFYADNAPARGPLQSVFATPPQTDPLVLFKVLAQRGAQIQSQILGAINAPLGSGSNSILSFFPPIDAPPAAPGLSLPGQQPAGSINAQSFLDAYYKPQFDLLDDLIRALG